MADDGLQFDRAEFEAPPGTPAGAQPAAGGPVCAFCGRPLTTTYWAVADQVSCGDCRERWHEALTGGSGALRFARAAVFGLIAAGLGAALYLGVALVSGYELALVAVAIGLMVGWAVRKGADHRGGGVYQALAMGLSYAAMVATPLLIRLLEHLAKSAEGEPTDPLLEGLVRTVFMRPFESFFGFVIIAFGLFEAWRMNKRMEIPMSGPHAVGPPPAAGDGSTPTPAQAPTP